MVFVIKEGTEYLRLYIENTFFGERRVDKNGVIRTTKADKKNHGISMGNIRQIVDKYDGKQEIKIEDGWFRIENFLHV